MTRIVVDVNLDQLRPIERHLAKIGNQVPHAIRRGVNRTGENARTPFIRAIAAAMGIVQRPVRRRLRVRRANFGRMEYRIIGFGGGIPLKYFHARETRAGVAHKAKDVSSPLKGGFIKGGRFPNRKPIGLSGHVWVRTGDGRFPIERQLGPSVPATMLESPAIDVFRQTAERRLIPNILHEVDAIMNGWAPRT